MDKNVFEAAALLNDPRVTGFVEARATTDYVKVGDFGVQTMPDFDPAQPAASQDEYHMYTLIGRNASNTKHHHDYGDVAVFFSETSPTNSHGKNNRERYVIVVDQWTGSRIKVLLPALPAAKEV